MTELEKLKAEIWPYVKGSVRAGYEVTTAFAKAAERMAAPNTIEELAREQGVEPADASKIIGAIPDMELPDEPSITLHDLFAMAALTGLIANPHCKDTDKEAARNAFNQADAMMKARDAK